MNSQLYDNEYSIPNDIINYIKDKLSSYGNTIGSRENGVERANNIIKTGKCTYQQLKKIKNYFDNIEDYGFNQKEFDLNGGILMKNFINQLLSTQRNIAKTKKNANLSEMKFFIESVVQDLLVENNNLEKSSIGVAFNTENKILLVKRGIKDHWMPNKWALVGGGVEEGETFEEALTREFKEETNLIISNIIYMFDRTPTNEKYEKIFMCDGDSSYIRLNHESQNYGWFSLNEIRILHERGETVPLLFEYCKLGILKRNNYKN